MNANTIEWLQTSMLFLMGAVFIVLGLIGYELSTDGIMIAGEYKVFYLSDVVKWVEGLL